MCQQLNAFLLSLMGAVSVSDVLYHQTCSIIDCSSVLLTNITECKGDVNSYKRIGLIVVVLIALR